MRKDALIVVVLAGLAVVGFYLFGFGKAQVKDSSKNVDVGLPDDSVNSKMSLQEVGGHNSSDDCYLVIKNVVYDVSSYLYQHPGGRRVIKSRCGSEVTGIFASIHSNFAWNLLDQYKVGVVGKSSGEFVAQDLGTEQELFEFLADKIHEKYPKAEVVNIKPSKNLYIAKIIYDNRLYELHLNKDGKIVGIEIQDEEYDWGVWDTDDDDLE